MTTTVRSRSRPPLAVRLLAVGLGAVVIWGLVVWLSTTVLADAPAAAVRIGNALLVSALTVPLVVLARRYLDRRPWAALGLQHPRGAGRPLLVGLAAFLVPSGLGLTAALATGWVDLHVQAPAAEIIGAVALLVPLVLVYEALPEALIFRGYVQRNLTTVMAPWLATVLQGVLFAVFGTALWVVTAGWDVLGERAAMFLGVGVVLGLLKVQTGSAWTSIGFHLAFQVVAQTLLGGRFVTGNEAGLLVAAVVVPFVLATTLAAFLHREEPNWSRPEPE